MPGSARKDIVREGEIGVYHTWSRCVQRAFLCGEDAYSGENFEHRRVWIKSLLEYQASVFACDVGNYSILSNHQHLIVRTRPDIAACWSDEEVAWRWKMAWPRWEDGQWTREPTDEEIEELLLKPDHLVVLRRNLASLSWLMARWKEPIAKMANAESDKRGHFYEARFGSRELVDEAAILCCSIYVDLNQIKAGMSVSLAESDCSGIQDRLRAGQNREAEKSVKKFHKRDDVAGDYQLETSQVEQLLADCFLSPIDQEGPLMLPHDSPVSGDSNASAARVNQTSACTVTPGDIVAVAELSSDVTNRETVVESDAQKDTRPTDAAESEHSPDSLETEGAPSFTRKRSQSGTPATRKIHSRLRRRRRPRASDNVILSIPFPQYLQIAEWTAEQTRAQLTHPPPAELESLLREREIDPLHWRAATENFAAWFHHAVGKASRLRGLLDHLRRQWIQGISHCRDVFT